MAADTRTAGILKVLWITLALNWTVALLKLLIGLKLNSLTVISDSVHSFVDGFSNIVAVIGMSIAAKPPDEDHPYGHKKFEVLATMALSGLLVFSAWEILTSAVDRILHPAQLPSFSWIGVAILVLTLGVNGFITWYESREGKRWKSDLLLADAAHTRSDLYATFLSITALVCAYKGWHGIDSIAAIGIVVLILKASYEVVSDCIVTVSDANRLDPREIKACAESVLGVHNAHAIRSHGMPTDIHIDMHIRIDENLSAREVFAIENEVTKTIKARFSGVTQVAIRHEPDNLDEAED